MLSYVEAFSLLESDHAVCGENDKCVVCGKCTCFGVKDVPMGYHQKSHWEIQSRDYTRFPAFDLAGDCTCRRVDIHQMHI